MVMEVLRNTGMDDEGLWIIKNFDWNQSASIIIDVGDTIKAFYIL